MNARQKYVMSFAKDPKSILQEGEKRHRYNKHKTEQVKFESKLRAIQKQAGVKAIKDKEEGPPDDGIDWHDFIIVQTVEVEGLNEDQEAIDDTQPVQKTEILKDAPLEEEMKIVKNYVMPTLEEREA